MILPLCSAIADLILSSVSSLGSTGPERHWHTGEGPEENTEIFRVLEHMAYVRTWYVQSDEKKGEGWILPLH